MTKQYGLYDRFDEFSTALPFRSSPSAAINLDSLTIMTMITQRLEVVPCVSSTFAYGQDMINQCRPNRCLVNLIGISAVRIRFQFGIAYFSPLRIISTFCSRRPGCRRVDWSMFQATRLPSLIDQPSTTWFHANSRGCPGHLVSERGGRI